MAALLKDTTPDRRHASTVVALMTGFGEAVRTLGMFEGWDFDELVAHYGAIVQAQVDACRAAATWNALSPNVGNSRTLHHLTQKKHHRSLPFLKKGRER